MISVVALGEYSENLNVAPIFVLGYTLTHPHPQCQVGFGFSSAVVCFYTLTSRFHHSHINHPTSHCPHFWPGLLGGALMRLECTLHRTPTYVGMGSEGEGGGWFKGVVGKGLHSEMGPMANPKPWFEKQKNSTEGYVREGGGSDYKMLFFLVLYKGNQGNLN